MIVSGRTPCEKYS